MRIPSAVSSLPPQASACRTMSNGSILKSLYVRGFGPAAWAYIGYSET